MTITERLRRGPVLLDGGLGSSLIARGLPASACAVLWNVERPAVVREVHAGYVRTGCDVIEANTFAGNAIALGDYGLAARMEELNAAGVRLARAAAEEASAARPVLVAGNLGPSGRFLAPVGDVDPRALEDAFAAQAAALAAAGADYLAIETMTDVQEALCALRGAVAATRLPVTACLTFERKRRGFFTLMGNRIEDAMRILAGAGAVAVGANCSIGSEAMREACPQLVAASPVPVIVKPNAGLPEIVAGRPVYRQSPADFARDVAAMAAAGAAAVGGCCGTDERFLAALRDELAAGTGGGAR
ncbi:MAG: homocysteine S-methyltransferase family protein [Planctomycetota bacterium]